MAGLTACLAWHEACGYGDMHPSQAHGAVRARRPIVVLLVDDQPFVGMAVSRLLASEEDIEVHCCFSALEAVAHANRLLPTLILQDLVMPEVDGLTLVGRFRDNPTTSRTPIVVLSGNDETASRAQSLAAGADDYIVKVPDKAALISCIRGHHANGQKAQDVASAIRPSDSSLDLGVIDEIRRTGTPNSADLVVGLVDLFLAEAGPLVERLKRAAAGAGGEGVQADAHNLRGTSMTMGARRLGALAAQVEERAHRLPDSAIEHEVIAALAEEYVRVRAACLTERDRSKLD